MTGRPLTVRVLGEVKREHVEERAPIRIEPPVTEIPKSKRVEKEKQKPLFEDLPDSPLPPLQLLDEPDGVVVGFDLTLTYARLCRAAWWIQQGKLFVATNPDRICPTDQPTVLVDCGSICASLTHATGKQPAAVLGKPDPSMLGGILERHGLQPGQIAMVGDRIYTDMMMAHRAGALGVLVLSGEATAPEAAMADPPPHLTVPSLAEFGAALVQTHRPSSFA